MKDKIVFQSSCPFLQTKLQGKTGKNIKIRHFFHTKQETFSILLMDFWQEEKKKKKIAYLSKPPFAIKPSPQATTYFYWDYE